MRVGSERKPKPSFFVANVSVFSAVYFALGTLLGFTAPILRGYPAHFFRGLLMSLLAMRVGVFGGVTLMGLISGLVFMVIPGTPAPYLLFSSFFAGLFYDGYMNVGGRYSERSLSRKHILAGTSLSGLAEALTALSIITVFGFFGAMLVGIIFIWLVAIAANLALGALGAFTAIKLGPRLVGSRIGGDASSH